MDLTSRLRSIVRPSGAPVRELTYEPDTGRYEATVDLDRVADVLAGRVVTNRFGRALIVDRRYESDRFHGTRRVGECEVPDGETLRLLDPALPPNDSLAPGEKTVFVDLETTGLSGGAGTVAFLVGCGWFDMGAFQVRQFLLTSYAAERALLDAVASCFDGTSLLVTYNGKTFDVPVMETRWMFHRMRMPLESVRHFDMLHPARRLWRSRDGADGFTDRLSGGDDGGCRLSTLERVLCGVRRVGDVPGLEIPGRYFRFLRTGDVRPLEAVLEHNRLDLISLAAVTAHAVQLVEAGTPLCRDAAETLALGKVYERAGCTDRAIDAYRRAAAAPGAHVDVVAEAIYRLAIRLRRDRRFAEAADCWRRLLDVKQGRSGRRSALLAPLRQVAVEALAIHHEHRERDYAGARELALQLLDEADGAAARVKTDTTRRRLARLERKLSTFSAPLLD
ncbi:MAG TPA: ribonuclease H-like domain-containing protein [Vicinamibacterales bacterium]|nr:ribonuclease H-like domain-containing protein [Vicinamibacterales bacterium]